MYIFWIKLSQKHEMFGLNHAEKDPSLQVCRLVVLKE